MPNFQYNAHPDDPTRVIKEYFADWSTKPPTHFPPKTVKTHLTNAVSRARKAGKRHLVVFKKIYLSHDGGSKVAQKRFSRAVVAELHVPLNAAMRQPNNRKCRASKAKVVAFYIRTKPVSVRSTLPEWTRTTSKKIVCYSSHAHTFTYHVGKTVEPIYPFENNNRECASGIHFFLSFKHAAAY